MTVTLNHTSCLQAGILLRQNRERIIKEWVGLCRETVSAAKHNNTVSVRDSVPDFLDELAKILENPVTTVEKNCPAAKEHGKERASLGNYTLDQVIYEYQILREVIVQYLDLERSLAQDARQVVHSFLDQGIRKAATRFSEIVHQEVNEERAKQNVSREKDLRLAKAIEISKLGYYEWDILKDRLVFSDQFKKDWELDSNISLKDAVLRIHPEDREIAVSKVQAAVANGTLCSNQYRLLMSDGSVRWIEAQGQAIYSPSGIALQFFGTSVDVSARKEAEETAERARRDLREFFVQAPVPLIILEGPTHVVTLANTLYEKLVGRSMTGKTLMEAFPNGEAEYYIPILNAVYETGIPYVGRELPLQLPKENGEIQNLNIDIAYHPFRHPQGKIKGVMALVYDVTEQVEARKRLQDSAAALATEKKKLEVLVTESSAAIGLMRGPDYIFEIANAKWRALVSDREYLGRPYADIYPELVNTSAFQSIKDTYTTGKPFTVSEMKLVVTSPAGRLEDQYFSYTNIRILDGDGNPYGVYCHALNVTEQVLTRKKIEESALTLAESNNRLHEEREIRERFVATLTHDLRTPMTAAKMSAEFIVRKANDSDPIHGSAERIVASVDRADRMIQDLLDANRLKAGEGIPIHVRECNLNKLLESTVSGLQELHGKRFEIHSTPREIIGVWDEAYLRRVIENLATNAIKYGEANTPVWINLRKENSWVEIQVRNEGEIILPEEQKTLFDPYRRTHSARASGKKGWGIGLTLVKGIAQAHGGSVRVESQSETGTTFFVSLPLDSRQFEQHS